MQVSLISGLSSAAEEAAIPGSDVLYVDLTTHSADREPMTLREVFLRSFVLENIIVGEASSVTQSSLASLGCARTDSAIWWLLPIFLFIGTLCCGVVCEREAW